VRGAGGGYLQVGDIVETEDGEHGEILRIFPDTGDVWLGPSKFGGPSLKQSPRKFAAGSLKRIWSPQADRDNANRRLAEIAAADERGAEYLRGEANRREGLLPR
jgi:hypothetical protein